MASFVAPFYMAWKKFVFFASDVSYLCLFLCLTTCRSAGHLRAAGTRVQRNRFSATQTTENYVDAGGVFIGDRSPCRNATLFVLLGGRL
jgi:hypothetical protein